VAKRTSVFDDPTKDIQDLTAIIKKDIGALSAAVADLQHLCDSQNESGNISRDTTSHSTTVIDNLKNRLMSTTNEFKDVLTMRTEVELCYFSFRKCIFAIASTQMFTINKNKAPMVLLFGK
jgi:syntaxin 5